MREAGNTFEELRTQPFEVPLESGLESRHLRCHHSHNFPPRHSPNRLPLLGHRSYDPAPLPYSVTAPMILRTRARTSFITSPEWPRHSQLCHRRPGNGTNAELSFLYQRRCRNTWLLEERRRTDLTSRQHTRHHISYFTKMSSDIEVGHHIPNS